MSGGKQSSKSTVSGWKPAMDQIESDLLPGISDYSQQYGDGQGLWSGSQLADEDRLVREGQQSQINQGRKFGRQIGDTINSLEGFIDYDPNSVQNQAQRQALADQTSATFNNVIRPGVEDRGTGAGQFGGNQQSLAMGAATQPLSRAIADNESAMMNADKNRAMQAIGMAPSLYQQQFVPGAMREQFGNQRSQRGQLEQMDEIQQFEAERNNRLRSLAEQQGLLSPLASLSQTQSSSSGGGGLLQTGLGLGSMALGGYLGGGGTLGSLFGSSGGMGAGGMGPPAPSSGLMGLFS